ncbi:ABC transporter permease [Halovivax cerinus]|uniref:ABC transporter permease n=1 Tax=Halovivax cerinus TaxID=1487865 RepID=A0ABD5NP73_9EURY|nr:ABC transporter permease [Halovivax cerinus]
MATNQQGSAGIGPTVRSVYDGNATLRRVLAIVPIVIVLLCWEVASGSVVSAEILPPFSAVVPEIVSLGGSTEFRTNAIDTLLRGFAGLLVAMAVAIPLGLLMARNDRIASAVEPVIGLSYPVPKAPMTPLLVFWLGWGHLPVVALAAVGGLLPILISTYNGASTVQEELLWVSRSLGIGRLRETYAVVFPASLPTILTGVRIGMIFSFIIVVSAEMIGGRAGLGNMVMQFSQYGQYEELFATVVLITAAVALLDRLYLRITAYLLRWSDQGVSAL